MRSSFPRYLSPLKRTILPANLRPSCEKHNAVDEDGEGITVKSGEEDPGRCGREWSVDERHGETLVTSVRLLISVELQRRRTI